MTNTSGNSDTPGDGYASTPDVLPLLARFASLLELGQNYPNPHAGETTVPFTLTATADVRLVILDALGREVTSVLRKGRGTGPQSIALNLAGLGLPPGEYVYRVEATTRTGVYQQSRPMITQ